jgi:small-conductance mechanosensitive channel
VLNLSHSDRLLLVNVPIQVAPGSDVELVCRLLLKAAEGVPRILADPPPLAIVKGFSDSGIDMNLGIWVADAEQGTGLLRSDIYTRMLREFAQHGVAIPYPRRDPQLTPPAAVVQTEQIEEN